MGLGHEEFSFFGGPKILNLSAPQFFLTRLSTAEQLPAPGEVDALTARSKALAAEAAALRREVAQAHAREQELQAQLGGKGGKELLLEIEVLKRRVDDYKQRERAIEHREEQMQKRVDAIKYVALGLLCASCWLCLLSRRM